MLRPTMRWSDGRSSPVEAGHAGPALMRLNQAFDLRRQNKVRFGQPINRMRPGRDLDLAPSQQDVGMMPLLLGDFANAIHECQGGLKVRKLVGTHDVMLADDIPLRGLR